MVWTAIAGSCPLDARGIVSKVGTTSSYVCCVHFATVELFHVLISVIPSDDPARVQGRRKHRNYQYRLPMQFRTLHALPLPHWLLRKGAVAQESKGRILTSTLKEVASQTPIDWRGQPSDISFRVGVA